MLSYMQHKLNTLFKKPFSVYKNPCLLNLNTMLERLFLSLFDNFQKYLSLRRLSLQANGATPAKSRTNGGGTCLGQFNSFFRA